MILQKLFENPKAPFCADSMLTCNLNEIINFTWNMLKKGLLLPVTIVVQYELYFTRQMVTNRESLPESQITQ